MKSEKWNVVAVLACVLMLAPLVLAKLFPGMAEVFAAIMVFGMFLLVIAASVEEIGGK